MGENGLSLRICSLALELIVEATLIFDTELPALVGNERIDFERSSLGAMPAYRTKCVSTLGASAQVDAPFSAV
ncbi:MAG: hypothetical protein EGQ34_01800 [Sutterella sp.]|nr:hypothetical protein [Sutterella sp.]